MGLKCKQLSTELGCYTDADGLKQTVVIHYEYGQDALGETILVSTIYTDAVGAPVSVGEVVVTPGACAKPSPDVEWELLCDDVNDDRTDIVQFFCQVITSFDDNCLPIVPPAVANYELDKATPYEPQGTVGKCEEECDPGVPVGLKTAWGAGK